MHIRVKLKKLLIWTLLAVFLSSGALTILAGPQKAKAAYNYSLPGKWYFSGNENRLVNEVTMTGQGSGSTTINWEYASYGTPTGEEQGRLIYKSWWIDRNINGVSVFRLAAPVDQIRGLPTTYYVFVQGPAADELKSKAILMAYKVELEQSPDFLWRASEFDAWSYFKEAHGGADTLLGQYLNQMAPYLRENRPTIEIQAATGVTDAAKKACQDYLAPSSASAINQLFEKINQQLGKKVIEPLTAAEDNELYHKFFRTSDSIDYSNTYIDTIHTPTYTAFNDEFHLAEQGLTWFWTDKQKSKEKSGIYTLIGAATILKVGGGVWTLAPAAAGAVATLSVDYYKKNVNEASWQKMARLIAAKVYLDAHMQYDRCIAKNTTDQSFKDKVAKEEEIFKMMMRTIDQEVADYIAAQTQADTGVLEGTCVTGKTRKDYGSAAFWISKALCGIIELIGDLADWLTRNLFKSVFNAYRGPPRQMVQSLLIDGLSIPKAHAADEVTTLSDALTNSSTNQWPWVISIWKFVLVLTDLFLVVILLFLGITTILHIPNDSYAIKKMLPLLIVGVILANFSLLIMRMLIDAANVLTNSFMGGVEPGDMVSSLIKSITITDKNPGFFEAWTNVGILLVGTIFAVFAMAAFLILGIMFYIRYAAIVLLAIAAPLAFISMAFPPTQSLFKLWWSWTTKFVFMKPIAFFLLMIALKVKDTKIASATDPAATTGATTSLTGWMIIIALVYMAILVPWKLGGAVMAMWGGAMGSIFGTKKGGYLRKPVDEWWGRKKDQASALPKIALPGLFKAAEKDRTKTETWKKIAENRIKKAAWEDPRMASWTEMARSSEVGLNKLMKEQTRDFYKGKGKIDFFIALVLGGLRLQGITPKLKKGARDFAKDILENDAELALADAQLKALQETVVLRNIARIAKNDRELTAQLDEEEDKLTHVRLNDDYSLDESEVLDEKGNPKKMTWRQYQELIAQLDEKLLIEQDPTKIAKMRASIAKLEKQANAFANTHRFTADGKPILYNAFMDKSYAGRPYALITKAMMEDVQVNQLNENPETMWERAHTEYGVKNMRGQPVHLHRTMRGEYEGVDESQQYAAATELKTYAEEIGRKGSGDRGRYAYTLFKIAEEAFQDYAGEGKELPEGVLGAFERALERRFAGRTADMLAEHITDATNRNTSVPGFEKFRGKTYTKAAAFIADARSQGIDPIMELAKRPEILGELNLTPGDTRTRARRAYMDALGDLVDETENFCAAGNIAGYMVKARNMPREKWFKNLKPGSEPSPQDQAARQAEQTQRQQAVRTFSNTLWDQTVARAGGPEQALAQHASTIQDIELNARDFVKTLKIDGVEVDPSLFLPVFDALASTGAKTIGDFLEDLQSKLSSSLQGKKLSIDIDPSVGVSEYRETAKGIQNIELIREQGVESAVKDVSDHVQIKPNDTLESIRASIANLEAATASLAGEISKRVASGDPKAPISKEVVENALNVYGERRSLIPLTREQLSASPDDLAAAMAKQFRGLAALINAGGSPSQEKMLSELRSELRKLRERQPVVNVVTEEPETPPTAEAAPAERAPYRPDEDRPESIP